MKFDTEKYKLLFISEAKEHLEEISKILNYSRERLSEDEINTLFREAHSIKGMSSAMGYNDISELSHAIENILGQLRSGQMVFSKDIMEALVESLDALWKAVESIEKNESYDIRNIVDRLKYQKFKEETTKSDSKEYLIEFSLLENIPSPSARAFLIYKNIESFGSIIDAMPAIDGIKRGEVSSSYKIKIKPFKPIELIKKYLSTIAEIKSFSIQPVQIITSEMKDTVKKDDRPNVPQQLKVQITDLDYFLNITGELLTIKSQIKDNIIGFENIEVANALNQMEILLKDLQNKVMKMRMMPLDIIFSSIPRWVRDLSHRLNKKVEIEIAGGDLELDRTVIEALSDPILHIIRNAIDHGIETTEERISKGKNPIGKIKVNAYKEKDRVIVVVSDDGIGIDVNKVKESALKSGKYSKDYISSLVDRKKIFHLLTTPGLSTKEEITDISGRGVGLDVVKTVLENFGGTLDIDSELGKGTDITLVIPATISIINVLLFNVAGYKLGTPVDKVESVLKVCEESKNIVFDKQNVILYKNEYIPLFSLSEKIGCNKNVNNTESNFAIITEILGKKTAILVDELIGYREVYLRPLNKPLSLISGFYSSTLLGDGTPILIVDLQGLFS